MSAMGSTRVSVLLPLDGDAHDAQQVQAAIARYLESTGFDFEILMLSPREGEGYGSLLRRGVSDARGSVVVVVDPALPYSVSAIGDAIALIESGSTEIVFAAASRPAPGAGWIRWLLVEILPDPRLRLKAFNASAARLVIGETKLSSASCDLEIAFLANRYGLRIEPLHVLLTSPPSAEPSYSAWSLGTVTAIRMTARRMGYRPARRCPVCFANEVRTTAQIPGNIVRACARCKCRYLNEFSIEEDVLPVRRVLSGPLPPIESRDETHSESARAKTAARRIAALRKHVPQRGRLLEVGVRDGSFGTAAAREFEYVGIDHAPAVVRATRAKGLEVYCATVSNFVNTGPAFDAVALFHVFENMGDPHDALARIKELLKPGGVLFLAVFDTEGLLYLLTERGRMAQNFRTHRILYSRSALIELLEHSGFEIDAIGPDFEHRDHRFVRHMVSSRWPVLAPLVRAVLQVLPDPLLVGTGSIRVVAKRRAGSPVDVRAIRSVEATHAR